MEAVRSAERLTEVIPLMEEYDVVGIDEGQFFEDCITFAETMANAGRIVIVAALDGYPTTLKSYSFSWLKLEPFNENLLVLFSTLFLWLRKSLN